MAMERMKDADNKISKMKYMNAERNEAWQKDSSIYYILYHIVIFRICICL